MFIAHRLVDIRVEAPSNKTNICCDLEILAYSVLLHAAITIQQQSEQICLTANLNNISHIITHNIQSIKKRTSSPTLYQGLVAVKRYVPTRNVDRPALHWKYMRGSSLYLGCTIGKS